MNFIDNLETETNRGDDRTENGALSYGHTMNSVLDFFSKSGSLRNNDKELLNYFDKALSENMSLSLKALFYMRDIRKGQGERDGFRVISKYLANKFPNEIKRNISYIPEFGRWDDLYSFVGTGLEKFTMELMEEQFNNDLNSDKEVSLLGKWLKSENTSSKESRRLAKITREYFGLTPREYRTKLTSLRKSISIVESKMSKKNWSDIDYSKVPSQASRIYSNSFMRNDTKRYESFIEDVVSGDTKINAGTLYPYDIVRNIEHRSEDEVKTYDALWKALPNFLEEGESVISVVDVSGSMTCGGASVAPIDVAVSLGIYFAERSFGDFKDSFITFSENPKVQKIKGTNIQEKVRNLRRADWGMSTNLQKVFDLILDVAVKNNTPQKDLPSKVFIISDMQFNEALKKVEISDHVILRATPEETNFESIDRKFKEAGYNRPDLVFWNVDGHSDTPVTKDEKGTFLVSGCSPSILKHAIKCEAQTPEELMLEVLNSERYEIIN